MRPEADDRTEEPSREPSRDDERADAAGTRSTVLLIEDDHDVRVALTQWLQSSGYAVVSVANGAEGLEQLEGGLCPSAILLDLMMPEMDGWSFLAHVRETPRHADLRVIVTTAVADEAPRSADALLAKPFDLAELSKTLGRFCGN